jgi:hypothetical protein
VHPRADPEPFCALTVQRIQVHFVLRVAREIDRVTAAGIDAVLEIGALLGDRDDFLLRYGISC